MLAELLLPLSFALTDQPTQEISAQPAPEQSRKFDYTYLDLGIAGINNHEVFDDGAALIGEASLGIGDHFYLFGYASRADFEPPANEIVKTYAGGVGFHTPMNWMSDFQVQVGVTSTKATGDAGDFDDSGFTVGFGARFHTTEKVEVNTLVSYADLDDAALYWRAGAVYEFNRYIAGTIHGQYSDDGTVAMVGMRLSP
jgi:hypothetical protein